MGNIVAGVLGFLEFWDGFLDAFMIIWKNKELRKCYMLHA